VSDRENGEAALIEQAKGDLSSFGDHLTARTFQRALEHLGRYEDRGAPFSAWLYRIAHNLVANWHRDRSRLQRRVTSLGQMLELQPRQDGPARLGEAGEEQAALASAIRRLPSDRQLLLVLKFSEELPNAQIGGIMGRSEGAIKSLYHRTLVALREDLEQRGFHR